MSQHYKAPLKRWTVVTLAAALITGLYFYFSATIELGRRRHQIGQVWGLIVIYYCPAHGDKFPTDLEELRRLPNYIQFVPYWDRASQEIELVAPGVHRTGKDVIVLRERQPDKRGRRWVHWLGGATELWNAHGQRDTSWWLE